MAQRMHGGLFLNATRPQCRLEAVLKALGTHGPAGCGWQDAVLGRLRKKPLGMAMGGPELAQHLQGAVRQGSITILGSLPVPYVHHHLLAIDVSNLEVNPLAQAQSTGIDCTRAHPITWLTDRPQEL